MALKQGPSKSSPEISGGCWKSGVLQNHISLEPPRAAFSLTGRAHLENEAVLRQVGQRYG